MYEFWLSSVFFSNTTAGHVEKEMTNSFFVAGSVNQTASGEMYHVVRDYSIWWQIPQYTLMGMSEVFTSIPGEEMYHMTTAAVLCLQFCKIIILMVGGSTRGLQ